MTDPKKPAQTVMHRMTHRQTPASADVPLTASRAVRMAVTRAAEQSIGLSLNVLGVGVEELDLDDLLAQVPTDHLITALLNDGNITGIIVSDAALCLAAVEVQTTGRVGASPITAREITGADAALVAPFLDAVLSELAATTPRTTLEDWVGPASIGGRLAGSRAAGFALPDQPYRLIKVSLDLGSAERQGQVMIALPPQVNAQVASTKEAPPEVDWNAAFRATVLAAPATLMAVLHRFNMPLAVATQMQVGQLIPLHGCTVGKLRLEAPDGRIVARARLGQVAGQIAVRIEDEEHLNLMDLPRSGAAAAGTEQLELAQ